ncbi:MAG: hypothetical protein Q7U16_06970 [Agitococcus sp.]|nr:hypothetical protein [Agitococcus sp.]
MTFKKTAFALLFSLMATNAAFAGGASKLSSRKQILICHVYGLSLTKLIALSSIEGSTLTSYKPWQQVVELPVKGGLKWWEFSALMTETVSSGNLVQDYENEIGSYVLTLSESEFLEEMTRCYESGRLAAKALPPERIIALKQEGARLYASALKEAKETQRLMNP